MDLESIKQAIATLSVRVTDHADEEMAADGLSLDAVLSATCAGEMIEEYPSDDRCPVAWCWDTRKAAIQFIVFGRIME